MYMVSSAHTCPFYDELTLPRVDPYITRQNRRRFRSSTTSWRGCRSLWWWSPRVLNRQVLALFIAWDYRMSTEYVLHVWKRTIHNVCPPWEKERFQYVSKIIKNAYYYFIFNLIYLFIYFCFIINIISNAYI